MKIGKILLYLLAIGCIVGLYAYKASESNKREMARVNRQWENDRRLQELRDAKEKEEREAEREAQRQQELEDNADNAEYQVGYWHKEYSKLHEKSFSVKLNSVQRDEINRNLEMAKSKLQYWVEKRLEEIDPEQEPEEYDKLIAILDKIGVSQDDSSEIEEHNSDDNYNDDL